ncbi:head decoration protein [Methylocaldum sp.]|uniref:head decoration protein n=1 Tax=Methylocaldum sp. TaxID=1969727 RepID=UPI002D24C4CB|nr:head decoration protein [Methylocaldum sp.]HYE35382.1 head decoration protein [Methylocaldum sp.]
MAQPVILLDPSRSLKDIIVAGGQTLPEGTVLTRTVTASTMTVTPGATNTGDGVIAGIAAHHRVRAGRYSVRITGVIQTPEERWELFDLKNPDGHVIGGGIVGQAFESGELSFTVNPGSLAFAVSDRFEIDVTDVIEKFEPLDPTETDGREIAAAVLRTDTDAMGGDTTASAIVCDARLYSGRLVWPAGITAEQTAIALADLSRAGLITD